MTKYLARKGNTGIFLSKTEQMDQFLAKGFDIYKLKDGEEFLIATPDIGYLNERPEIEKTATININQ